VLDTSTAELRDREQPGPNVHRDADGLAAAFLALAGVSS
jgi:hypothetical protein